MLLVQVAVLLAFSTVAHSSVVDYSAFGVIPKDVLNCCPGWTHKQNNVSGEHICFMSLVNVHSEIRDTVCKNLKGRLESTDCEMVLTEQSECFQSQNLDETKLCTKYFQPYHGFIDYAEHKGIKVQMRSEVNEVRVAVEGGWNDTRVRFVKRRDRIRLHENETVFLEIKSQKGAAEFAAKLDGMKWGHVRKYGKVDNPVFDSQFNELMITWPDQVSDQATVYVNGKRVNEKPWKVNRNESELVHVFGALPPPKIAAIELGTPQITPSVHIDKEQVVLASFDVIENKTAFTISIGAELLMRVDLLEKMDITFQNLKTGVVKVIPDQRFITHEHKTRKMFFIFGKDDVKITIGTYVVFHEKLVIGKKGLELKFPKEIKINSLTQVTEKVVQAFVR